MGFYLTDESVETARQPASFSRSASVPKTAYSRFSRGGRINQYVFCANDPVNNKDPLGLWRWDDDYIQYGVANLVGLGDMSVGESWDAFAEGWSRGGQGVVNAFTGGLFDPKSGLFYDTFNQQWNDIGKKGNDCDEGFRTGMIGGRVAESALLVAGVLWGVEATTAIRFEVHGTHGWTSPHLQAIRGPGWGKTIGRFPPHSWTPQWWTQFLKKWIYFFICRRIEPCTS